MDFQIRKFREMRPSYLRLGIIFLVLFAVMHFTGVLLAELRYIQRA